MRHWCSRIGLLLVVALVVAMVGAATRTASAATFTYDAPALARVDAHASALAEAGQGAPVGVWEWPASPSAEARGTSTTVSSRKIATEAESELGLVCHSFAPRTEVVMADGSLKQIADVKVGDRDRTTDPATGKAVVRMVTALHHHDTDLADLVVRGCSDYLCW
jgi:hypothetical protein